MGIYDNHKELIQSIIFRTQTPTETIPHILSTAGEMIIPNERYAMTETDNSMYAIQMVLVIRRLQKSDFGGYKCISKNSIGGIEATIRLYGKCIANSMCDVVWQREFKDRARYGKARVANIRTTAYITAVRVYSGIGEELICMVSMSAWSAFAANQPNVDTYKDRRKYIYLSFGAIYKQWSNRQNIYTRRVNKRISSLDG